MARARRSVLRCLILLHRALREREQYELQSMVLGRILMLQNETKAKASERASTQAEMTRNLAKQNRFAECRAAGQQALSLYGTVEKPRRLSVLNLHFWLAHCERAGGAGSPAAQNRALVHLQRATPSPKRPVLTSSAAASLALQGAHSARPGAL